MSYNYQLERDKSLYFEDGDIVLAAPTTRRPERRTILFRIDKIFLSRHSPIFKNMLSFDPGQEPHDTYDGVPRVDLTDPAEDLQTLLGAMYNVATLPLRRFDPDKPLKSMGTMRLAVKYEVDGIREVIVRSVEEDWPHDVKSYESWHTERVRILERHSEDWWRHFPEPATAMQFATEFGCSSILTGILYYMTTIPATLTIQDPKGEQAHHPPSPHIIRWNLLDATNFFRLQIMQQCVKESLVQCELYLHANISEPDCCHHLRYAAFADYIALDIMRPNTFVIDAYKKEDVCGMCLDQIDENLEMFSQYKIWLWDELSHCDTKLPVPWPEITQENAHSAMT